MNQTAYDRAYAAARAADIDAQIKSHQDAIKALRAQRKQYAAVALITAGDD